MGGVSYGQNPKITIDPTSTDISQVSSYVIGVCRNNTKHQEGVIGDFVNKMKKYKGDIKPRFGTGRKLYRLGGSHIDGFNGYENFEGYFSPTDQYADGFGGPGWHYPYDDFKYFVKDAEDLDADMIVGINVGSGSPSEATKFIKEVLEKTSLDKIAYFELGNELYGDWQVGHNMYACSPEAYRKRAAEFIDYFEANLPSIFGKMKFAVMGSYNGAWASFPSTIRIVENSSTEFEVENSATWWSVEDGNVTLEWTPAPTTATGIKAFYSVAPTGEVQVRVRKNNILQDIVSTTNTCASTTPGSDWPNTSYSALDIVKSYTNIQHPLKSPLMRNGKPRFQYVAYHNYANLWEFANGGFCDGSNTVSPSDDCYLSVGVSGVTLDEKGTLDNPSDDLISFNIIVNNCKAGGSIQFSDSSPNPDPVCKDGGLVLLVGAPSGGTFSGTGLTVDNTPPEPVTYFDPAVGTQTISYTQPNGVIIQKTIKVLAPSTWTTNSTFSGTTGIQTTITAPMPNQELSFDVSSGSCQRTVTIRKPLVSNALYEQVAAISPHYRTNLDKVKAKLDKYNVHLTATEYGSINVIGAPSPLGHSISEALFAAETIMDAIRYDMKGATAFGLFHANADIADNLFFPNGANSSQTPYPVFFAQQIIAQHTGNYYFPTTIENPGSFNVDLCHNNGTDAIHEVESIVTKDADGKLYVLMLNKSRGNKPKIDLDGINPNDYSAVLYSYSGADVLDAPTGIIMDNTINLSNLKINPLSINVLELTPTCHDYTINQNTTWPNSAYPGPYGKVEVTNGATLTIDQGYEARFCTDGELDILANSKVELKDGILTAQNTEWKGVRLYNQSTFEGKPNSVVTKAQVGIQSEMGPLGYSTSTINCDQVDFIDNEVAVDLSWSGFHSVFRQCTFKNTTAYNHSSAFDSFIKLYHTAGIKIEGCSFTDERGDAFWGKGIHATDAGFNVVADGTTKNVFSRLTTAIAVNGVFLFPLPVTIHDSQFDFCGVGVSNIGVTGIDIRRNHFNFDSEYVPAGGGWFNQYQYGVLMSHGIESFVLEDNDFDLITCSGSSCRKIGVQLSNLGTTPNVVRGNRFKGNVFANHAIGQNGYLPDAVGLLYECNTMTNNEVDFLTSHDPVIKIEQGTYSIQQQKFIPAQNTFAPNGTYSWDFYHGLQSNVPNVDYYHRNTVDEIPNHFHGIEPKVTTLNNDGCAEFTGKPGKGLTEAEREENLKLYEESRLNYEVVKGELKAAQESGDEVLAKQKRNETSYHATQKWKYANIGYMASLYDESRENRDEIRMWIRRFGTFEGDLMLASDFAGTNEWATAQQVLDMLPQKYELSESDYQDISNYEAIFYILSRESVTDLSQPSKEWLDNLAESGVGYASGKARSIMSLYGKVYQPLVADGLAFGTDEESGKEEETTKMLVSPNPADYNVTFDWSAFIISSEESVKIEITNKSGALVQVLQPAVGQTMLEWTTELVPSGINYYRLLIDGEEVDSGQLFINK